MSLNVYRWGSGYHQLAAWISPAPSFGGLAERWNHARFRHGISYAIRARVCALPRVNIFVAGIACSCRAEVAEGSLVVSVQCRVGTHGLMKSRMWAGETRCGAGRLFPFRELH